MSLARQKNLSLQHRQTDAPVCVCAGPDRGHAWPEHAEPPLGMRHFTDALPRPGNAKSTYVAPWTVAALCVVCAFTGCAAITNPIAHGVPVRMLPEELLAESREGLEPIPLTLLRQEKPDEYLLAPGDILGVYIEGIIGSAETPPPVNIPSVADLPPSIGYPIPIRADGTISLPLAGVVNLEGLTVEAAEAKVIEAYTESEIVQQENKRILVTLMRPRSVSVIVIREDSAQRQVTLRNESLLGLGSNETTIGGGRQGTGEAIELAAYENDVLHALARTGGLPGLESTGEVIIQRGYWRTAAGDSAGGGVAPAEGDARPEIIRIPLKIRPGQQVNFSPEDILLHNGDIVTVQGREPEFFYTGGILPSGEFPLPTNYDLTVVEAVLKARGPVLNGGVNTSNINGLILSPGLGNPSPNLLTVLRKTPGTNHQVMIRVELDEAFRDPRQNILVQAGDVLILQETPDQALARYVSQILRADFFVRWLNRNDAQGTASVAVP
jgi:protein involved in polysaccharide export with SLBB domain